MHFMKLQVNIQNQPLPTTTNQFPDHLKMIPGPYYYYNMELLKRTASTLMDIAAEKNINVHYAIKANNNKPILALLSAYGMGADCVSGPEIKTALDSGFPASKIVFAGVGKSDDEIKFALEQNIFCFNSESPQELMVINEIASDSGRKANVALRINPDYDAGTHKKITTATRKDKFGIHPDELDHTLEILKKSAHLNFRGLHFHIGSQILDLRTFAGLAKHINETQKYFKERGFFPRIINAGGGLGVDYQNPDTAAVPAFKGWIDTLVRNINLDPGQELHIEPGRSVVAQCGSLISKVLYIKKSEPYNFAIINAGMNDLMRPALYGATHKIQKLGSTGSVKSYTVAGPVCESSDVFARNISLPELQRNDTLIIRSTGAYGQSMASNYNLRGHIPDYYSNKKI